MITEQAYYFTFFTTYFVCPKVKLSCYQVYDALSTDRESPVISTVLKDMRVNTDPSLPFAVVTWKTVTTTDNSGFVSITTNFQSGDSFPIGSTDVLYTATDQSGNIATMCFTVTVEGNFIVKTI